MTLTIQAPSSKSLSHRSLIAAFMAQGESTLFNMLSSQDIKKTISCLQALGAMIRKADGKLMVEGAGIDQSGAYADSDTVYLDVGESGTTCRLLTAVAALHHAPCRIFGRGRMHERPLGQLTQALQKQGTIIRWEGREGYPPLIVFPQGLSGGHIWVNLEESSQFLSALLLAAPGAREETVISLSGRKTVSWPYVGLTLQVMEAFKISFSVQELSEGKWQEKQWRKIRSPLPGKIRFKVKPGPYKPKKYKIEGDWSNASYFLAAGALLPDGIIVSNVYADSIQGDRSFLDILKEMGVQCSCSQDRVRVSPASLQGVDADMGQCPDLVPTVTVLASLARGVSRLRNIAHLKLKESDRLQALAGEVSKTGCRIELRCGEMIIRPGPSPAGMELSFSTFGDHRLAMSLALYELAGTRVHLDDPDCVSKSFPDFWDHWRMVRKQAGMNKESLLL